MSQGTHVASRSQEKRGNGSPLEAQEETWIVAQRNRLLISELQHHKMYLYCCLFSTPTPFF